MLCCSVLCCRAAAEWWRLRGRRWPQPHAARGLRSEPELSLQLGSQHHVWAPVSENSSGPARPGLQGCGRQTPRGAPPAHPLSGGVSHTIKDREDVGLSPTSAAHFSKCWVWVLLQTSIYDSYFCTVGFPLTDPQRQILCINRARKNRAKLSTRGENLDVWSKQTQPSPAATHFSCGGNRMEIWIQGALRTQASAKSTVKNLYVLSPYPSIS